MREPVWDLSLRSAGLCARFVTDAAAIKVRWTLRMARPSQHPTNERALVEGLPSGWHEFLLYLPLHNGVESGVIGLPPEASLAKAPPPPPGPPQADRLPSARPVGVHAAVFAAGTLVTGTGLRARSRAADSPL